MTSRTHTSRSILRALAWGFLAAPMAAVTLACAQSQPPEHSSQGQDSKEHRPGPPPEALQACSSKKMDDACSFTGPRGTLEGACWAPQDKPLACRPKDRREPPPAQK